MWSIRPQARRGLGRIRSRVLAAGVAACVAGGASVASLPVAGAEPAPGFVSVMFGRMQWTTVDATCTPLRNTIDLGVVDDALRARDIRPTGIVIT